MAVSNTFTFELNQDQIIEAALRKLGVLAEGHSASAAQLSTGQQALNSMINLFAVEDGMPLWYILQTSTSLVANQSTYTVADAVSVYQVLRKNTASGTQVPLVRVSRSEFNLLNASDTGLPNTYFVDVGIDDPIVTVWPKPTAAVAAAETLIIVYQKDFDDFTATADTPAFPVYWTDALIYGLASRLAPEYGIPLEDRKMLMSEARMYKEAAMYYKGDDTSIFFYPEH